MEGKKKISSRNKCVEHCKQREQNMVILSLEPIDNTVTVLPGVHYIILCSINKVKIGQNILDTP